MIFNSFIAICFLFVCLSFIHGAICDKPDATSSVKTIRQARLKRRGVNKRYVCSEVLADGSCVVSNTVNNVPVVAGAQIPASPPPTVQAETYPQQQQANYYPANYYPVAAAYPPAASPATASSSGAANSNAGLNSITGLVSGLKLPALPSFAPAAGAQQQGNVYPGYYGTPPAPKGNDDDDDEDDDGDDNEDDDKDDGLNDDNE